jgi:hypothetical protein
MSRTAIILLEMVNNNVNVSLINISTFYDSSKYSLHIWFNRKFLLPYRESYAPVHAEVAYSSLDDLRHCTQHDQLCPSARNTCDVNYHTKCQFSLHQNWPKNFPSRKLRLSLGLFDGLNMGLYIVSINTSVQASIR